MMDLTPTHATPSRPNVIRRRWDGPLAGEQLARAHREGIRLAYDPAQNGWVPVTAPDGDDDPDVPLRASQPPLLLRPWRAQDLDQYHALLDDPALWRYMVEEMPRPFTREVAADLIAISNLGAHHEVRAIATPHVAAGQVRIVWISPQLAHGDAEISYWLGRPFRGQGLATQAVRHMVRDALRSRPGLRRIVAYVHPENAASARVLERAGFVPAADRASDGWRGFAVTLPTR
jgi:RimJ/RimL family protein N-acetyltransferase